MKILHLISGLQYGGAENLLLQLLQTTAFSAFEHRVISLTGSGPIGEAMQEHGIEVVGVDFHPRPTLRALRELLRTIRDFQPDLVQTWLYHADFAGAILRLLGAYRAPLVWSVHHATRHLADFKPTTRIIIHLNRLLSRHIPQQIVCCSQSVYDAHLRLGYPAERMQIISNGIDCDRFQADPRQSAALKTKLGLSTNAILIGYGARWIPSKGHRILIEAFGQLSLTFPDLHIVLWGKGINEDNTALTDLLQQHNMSNHVHLLGPVAEVEDILQGLDLYVSPSLDEALPLSVTEAMACQVPCVVTDVGDQGELVGPTGTIVPPTNADLLENGIKACLQLPTDSRNEQGNQARQRVLTHYTIERTAKAYAQVYQNFFER